MVSTRRHSIYLQESAQVASGLGLICFASGSILAALLRVSLNSCSQILYGLREEIKIQCGYRILTLHFASCCKETRMDSKAADHWYGLMAFSWLLIGKRCHFATDGISTLIIVFWWCCLSLKQKQAVQLNVVSWLLFSLLQGSAALICQFCFSLPPST